MALRPSGTQRTVILLRNVILLRCERDNPPAAVTCRNARTLTEIAVSVRLMGHTHASTDSQLETAEALCAAKGLSLTPLRRRVLELLLEADGPVKAYDLLATLKPDGSAQPPTVYRALDFLTQAGLAHRVEAINAYMACIHQHDGDVAELFICEKCSKVLETHREVTSGEAPEGFRIERSVIEHYGRCADCR